ncbi:3773_t:CDS:2, partial [Funneliformis geosporum]
MNDEPSEENPSNIHSDDDNISIAFKLSDEDSDTDDDENLELDIPEQPIRNHHPSLLDLRLKILFNWDEEIQNKAKEELR